MKKIMFVCTGNICRSAMAEYLLRDKLEKLSLQDKIKVYSSGISAYAGDIPTYEAVSVMKKLYNIDMTSHRATPSRYADVEGMDLILWMTRSHVSSLKLMYPNMSNKIFLLNDYVSNGTDISDPWGYGIDVYTKCIKEIDESLELLLKKECLK